MARDHANQGRLVLAVLPGSSAEMLLRVPGRFVSLGCSQLHALHTPSQRTFRARGFGVFDFLPSQRGHGFRGTCSVGFMATSRQGA